MKQFWTVALSIGGLGAIGAFVFWSLYRGWLKLGIFRKLTSSQTFRLMLVFLILAFIFCSIALLGFLFRNKFPEWSAPAPPLTVEQLRNGTYNIMGEMVTLKDGMRRWHTEKEGQTTELEDVDLREVGFGDLNGDDSSDAAVLLVANLGGTGHFYYLYPVINKGGSPFIGSTPFELGDRIFTKSIAIVDRVAEIKLLTHDTNDALCCPTKISTIHLRLDGEKFVCIDQDCKDLSQ